MHVCFHRWLASLLAATLALSGTSLALAQYGPNMPTDPGYAQLNTGVESQMVSSNYSADKEKDLAARVKDLESALKKVNDKAAADKKKAEGAPTCKLGGFFFVDSDWFGQNAVSRASVLGDAQDTTYFRTARLSAEGEGFGVMFYKIELDFAGRTDFATGAASAGGAHTHPVSGIEQTLWKDVFVGIRELPLLGRVAVGHFKEPFGLEELTSDRFTSFMERGLTSALTPSRNIGVGAVNNWLGENATWAVGCFRTLGDAPPYLADDRGFYAGTGRLTWLPWYDEASDGRGLLHVGGAYSYRDFSNSSVRVASRPESGAGPNVIDTRISGVDTLTNVADEHLVGAEAAMVYGPLSLQAEWINALYERTGNLQDPTFNGGYFYCSYFLTGEHRPYRRSTGVFDRVKPYTNFFRVRTSDCSVETGCGAWEVLYRYSYLNADSAGILGGYASDHTFGVNWYLNPYMRLMANYVHSNDSLRNNGPDTYIDVLMVRAAVDF